MIDINKQNEIQQTGLKLTTPKLQQQPSDIPNINIHLNNPKIISTPPQQTTEQSHSRGNAHENGNSSPKMRVDETPGNMPGSINGYQSSHNYQNQNYYDKNGNKMEFTKIVNDKVQGAFQSAGDLNINNTNQ